MAVNLPKALLVDLDDTILLYDAVAPEVPSLYHSAHFEHSLFRTTR